MAVEELRLGPGRTIKVARAIAGLTQERLAQKLGVPQATIGQWEREVREPSPEMWRRIWEALSS